MSILSIVQTKKLNKIIICQLSGASQQSGVENMSKGTKSPLRPKGYFYFYKTHKVEGTPNRAIFLFSKA